MGNFIFLELNPRLQVEHPTTEIITKVNLPACQLLVAMGIPLVQILDLQRLFQSNSELLMANRMPPKGHVIAARITAENPDAGFKPNSGKLLELNFRGNTDVWGYFSVGISGGLHAYADSQFGHVFAYGQNRDEAKQNMVMALKELSIRGEFRTTVEYIVKLLETDIFRENRITTAWLDELIKQKFKSERPDRMTVVVCGAICLAVTEFNSLFTQCQELIEKQQLPPNSMLKSSVDVQFVYEAVQYKLKVSESSESYYIIHLNNSFIHICARKMADGGLLISLAGKNQMAYWKKERKHSPNN